MHDEAQPDPPAPRAVAEAVRDACARAAAAAFRDGGYAGLCAEGRVELALDAIRAVPLDAILERVGRDE